MWGDDTISEEFFSKHTDSNSQQIRDVATFVQYINHVIDNYRANKLPGLEEHVISHASHSEGKFLFETTQSQLFSELMKRGMFLYEQHLDEKLSSKKRFRVEVLVRKDGELVPSRNSLRVNKSDFSSTDPLAKVYLVAENIDISAQSESQHYVPSYRIIMNAFKFEINEPEPIPSLISTWSERGALACNRNAALDIYKAKITTRLLMDKIFNYGFSRPEDLLDACISHCRQEHDEEKAARVRKMLRIVFTDVFCCHKVSSDARTEILEMLEARYKIETEKNRVSATSEFLASLIRYLKEASTVKHDEAPFRLSSKVAKYLKLAKERFPIKNIDTPQIIGTSWHEPPRRY